MAEDRCDLLCLDLPRAEALRRDLPPLASLEAVAERARALADPTRLAVALALGQGDELCVCALAWVVGRADKLVSRHVGVLRAAGTVSRRRDGKMVMCRLTEAGGALLRAVRADEEAVT